MPGRWRGRLADRHLQLTRLDPGPRRAAVTGLVLAGLAAVAMVLPTWPGIALNPPDVCRLPTGRQVTAYAAAVVSLAAMAYGLSLVGRAATARGAQGWRLSRTRFLLTLLLPVVLVLTSVAVTFAPGFSWLALVANHLRAGLLFVALVLIVAVATATRGRGPRAGGAVGLLAALAVAAVLLHAVLTAAVSDVCTGVFLLAGALTVLGFFGLMAVPVLLVWLAVEGLRLSGSLTVWAMARRPERSLLAVLLGLKLLVGAVLGVLVLTGTGPPGIAGFSPRPSTWVFSAVLVVLVCGLLSAEQRLVGSTAEDYALVTRWFTVLVASTVLFLPLTGLTAALGPMRGRPLLLLALVAVVGCGVLCGWLYRRRGALPVVVVPAALLVAYALLSLGWLTPQVPAPSPGQNLARAVLSAAVPLLVLLVATVLLLVLRPGWRRHIAFGVGLVVWIALNTALPVATGGRLGSDPVVFDVLLTIAIAGLAVAGRAGWQSSVTVDELLLLLAFLSPGLAAVTLEAGPLNSDPVDAPHRVHTTIGLLCVGYGLVSAMALSVRGPLELMQDLAGFFNGVAAVPFAVVLVAVLSADRQRAAAGVAGSPVRSP